MAKPKVPTGPISMDKKPDPLSVKAIKGSIDSLAAMDLAALQKLIDQREWSRAINALDAISAKARTVQNAAGRLASRAAKQHWNPLLETIANQQEVS